jgi:hypothetical protein
MRVERADIPATERRDFEQAIRACGKDPGAFRAELFQACCDEAGVLRRVHVVTVGAAAQYEASPGSPWTEKFARHLAMGVFG